ncbi:ribonuclease H-like domain-containing protein [Tanacetum coccineum]|uniref:Ribonuclease H-like domain-containing protein n=1 Tax=Tanacetum coccineum TaxID=301880 RepID=A0ABQ5FVR8_9ASTR
MVQYKSQRYNGQIRVLPPKTAEEILDRERERKARTTLLMSILKDHLEKFHKMTDAKDMWEAIKSRFSGNDESKKMQKYILKQQFEAFMFQSLLSQLRIHGAGVSTEDANQKFLRSLPASWSQVSLIMRTKPGVDTLSFDDLYNNLRVFESDIKGSTASSSSTENVDEFDLEEMDLKWQVAMISMRLKKFYKKTGRRLQFDAKEPVGFDKTKDEPNALVILDGDGTDWTGHAEDEQENFALMAHSNSGSNTEVTSWSKECKESYAKLKKLYDNKGTTFMKIDLDDKTNVLTYHKKLLAEAVKEKEELKTKLENFQSSSKGLSKLLNSQMSTRDKSGLGYGNQIHEGVLSYEKEVLESVFDSRSSDVEDSHVNDRFAKVEGMHVVPLQMTGITCLLKFDLELDGVKFLLCVMGDDEYVVQPSKEQEKPSFAFVKHVKTHRETIKEQNTCNQSSKVDKRDWNGLMSKKLGLGYGFTRKACFVCGSFGHLIRDCDFHEKRMAKQVELNKKKSKSTGQGQNRPVWNNMQRLNHQNKFVPTAVLIRNGRFPVNTARHNFNSQAVSTSAARKANVVRPIMNGVRPRPIFNKTYSPIRRPFNRTTTPKTNFSNQKVNTAGDIAVSAVRGIRETADDPQKTLKGKGIVDSGCSRHVTGNKAYLVEYQEFQGGYVVFGELQDFNLFSVSQMCDKKNKVLFTNTECLVLSPGFKLPGENQVLLRIPRQNNMYSFNLENIVPTGGLACLIAKATVDESNKWHRRFSWVFFLRTKDETSGILKDFIIQIENQLNQKVKTIRCDNGTKFKNRDIIEFYGSKGIKREYSNARTPQQSGVAERKNRTLIEGDRTMLADSFLPNIFLAEVVSTACYVLNRVLVTKPQNKTPYELITGKIPIISYIRPFGCHVTILNTIDHLGKFKEKYDEGFLVGYSLKRKAFRLTDSMNYQPVTAENKANKTASPKEANNSAGTQDYNDAGNSKMEAEPAQEYSVLPLWSSYTSTIKSSEAKNGSEKPNGDIDSKTNEEPVDQAHQIFFEELERSYQNGIYRPFVIFSHTKHVFLGI